MKTLRWRLTAWFAVSLAIVVVLLMAAAHWHLDYELRQEKWERTNPAQPGWVLHGSFTDQEVHDILGELAEFWIVLAVPLVALALVAANLIARRSTRPVRRINEQLNRMGIQTLTERVQAPEADPEIRELVRHLNELLGRLQGSFTHLREYTGHVAHELRTPLQLMRLRIEANAAGMSPELAEDLQEELARLSRYVETALTLAHAEQGRIETKPAAVPLRPFLADLLEPFARLAEADGRKVLWTCEASALVWADRDLLKQILVNVLNNALKHGAGDVYLRVRQRAGRMDLIIGNLIAPQAAAPGLGLGLRLIAALAPQLPAGRVSFHRGRHFWARLILQIPVEAAFGPARATSAATADSGT